MIYGKCNFILYFFPDKVLEINVWYLVLFSCHGLLISTWGSVIWVLLCKLLQKMDLMKFMLEINQIWGKSMDKTGCS